MMRMLFPKSTPVDSEVVHDAVEAKTNETERKKKSQADDNRPLDGGIMISVGSNDDQ
jgi:hypothetical protein